MALTVIDLSRPGGGVFATDQGFGFDTIGESPGGFAGVSVATGDFNGDGFGDYIVGEPNADPSSVDNGGPGVPDAGVVHVVLGRAYGENEVIGTIQLPSLAADRGAFQLYGANNNDQLGFSVANAGDFNGDGIDDILVGAPKAGPDGVGAAYLFYGANGTFNLFPIELSTQSGQDATSEILGTTIGGRLGTSVQGIGDINMDGFADIAVGAPFGGDPLNSQGEVYVIFGRAGPLADLNVGALAPADGFTITGAASGDLLGASIGGIPEAFLGGFINNDGFPDFIIGAPGNDENGDDAGAAYVIYGKQTGFGDLDLSTLANTDGWKILGPIPGARAGAAVTVIRDDRQFDDKAIDSVAIGLPGLNQGEVAQGGVAVAFGFDAATRSTLDLSAFPDNEAIVFVGESAGDALGTSLAGFNPHSTVRTGPGAFEEGIVVGAPGSDKVYAIYAEALNKPLGLAEIEKLGSQDVATILGLPDSGFGRSVAGGLFEYASGSEFAYDFVVGAPFFNFSGPSMPGHAYVFTLTQDLARGDEFRLLNTDDSGSAIVGNGTVFGTQGYQNITIIDGIGNVALDPSFNVGGDDVTFPGDAADWIVGVVGSGAEFRDGETSVFIPLGNNTIFLGFDDGLRTLFIDTNANAAMFSDQVLSTTFEQATGVSEPFSPLSPNPEQASSLILNPGVDITVGGRIDAFGTSSGEMFTVQPFSQINFDPSVNAGGDTIVLPGVASGYLASLSGSNAVIDTGGASAIVPISTNGVTLTFDDQSLMLIVDTTAGLPMIGATALDNTPMSFA